MNMKKFYSMRIGESKDLQRKVEKLGRFLREEWIPEYYRNAKVYKYENDVYYIDCIIGVIDIKEG